MSKWILYAAIAYLLIKHGPISGTVVLNGQVYPWTIKPPTPEAVLGVVNELKVWLDSQGVVIALASPTGK